MPVSDDMYNTGKNASSGNGSSINNELQTANDIMKLKNQISPYGSGTGAVLNNLGAGAPYPSAVGTKTGN